MDDFVQGEIRNMYKYVRHLRISISSSIIQHCKMLNQLQLHLKTAFQVIIIHPQLVTMKSNLYLVFAALAFVANEAPTPTRTLIGPMSASELLEPTEFQA
jgi:hypothetical protein